MKIIHQLLSIGVRLTQTPKEKKRIKVLNLATYISLINVVFFLIFDCFLEILNTNRLVTFLLELFLYGSIIYFQHRQLLFFSRLFYTTIIFSNMFYHCNFAFMGYYGEYQYIVIPLFSLFFFDKKYIHYTSLILILIAFYIPNQYLNIYPEKYFGYANVLLLFVGIFFIVQLFKTLNDKNEELLNIEKNNALLDKITLEKQREELNKLNDFKSNFFVNISHEIRTPITLIKGYASRINLKENETENIENLSIIKSQTKNIQDIVDSILDLSKLEASELEIKTEPVSINSLIQKAHADFYGVFKRKEISFTIKTIKNSVLVALDVNLFKKSLNNLLHNALKFTPQKGQVELNINFKNKDLEITITDNGIGIPQEDVENVFERFYQSKNDITNSQGSGIGLAFTKNILEAHGFQLHLESNPSVQTKFTISIPASSVSFVKDVELNQNEVSNHIVERDTTFIKPNVTENEKAKKILLVEDHLEMRDYLKLVLNDYNVIEACNGEEGLEAIKNNKFDVIITDYMMPIMDGVNFINEIKQQSIKIPIIVLTAKNDDTGKLDMLRLGIDSYITKPFLEEELLLNVKKVMFFHNEIKNFENKILVGEKLNLNKEEELFNTQLKTIIKSNYQYKTFGVDDLAEKLALSRSSLFRKTKLFLGQTPNEIIGEIRFKKAKELIEQNPKISKKDIADAVGIYNASYFYKKLKQRFDG